MQSSADAALTQVLAALPGLAHHAWQFSNEHAHIAVHVFWAAAERRETAVRRSNEGLTDEDMHKLRIFCSAYRTTHKTPAECKERRDVRMHAKPCAY